MIRRAAVAGRFYPGRRSELTEALKSYAEPAEQRVRAVGLVVPHAGYIYSGHVAGAVYSRVELPSRYVILCPNHTGFGPPLSVMKAGAWETPLGEILIDEEMAAAIMKQEEALEDDTFAHQFEHALEVQLPFLQHLAGREVRFVPITIGTSQLARLQALGAAIAMAVEAIDRSTLVVASSDMNHYEPDSVTRIKDRKAIDKVLEIDPKGLYDVVHKEDISMCGYAPTISMLTAARSLGASSAELVKYATSGDVSGDFSSVVGYAGLIIR